MGDLDSLAGGSESLDLSSLGFQKLLGTGSVSGAYEIKVGSFTKKAQAKIEAAGGKIVVQE